MASHGRQIRRLIGRRLLLAVPVLFGASVLVFAAGRIATANPSASALSVFATPATRAEFERQRHLDKPLPVQYGLWLSDAVRGDFGASLISSQPVTDAVGGGLRVTAELAVGAFLITLVVGLALGTVAGIRRGSRLDRAITRGSLVGVSLPAFWLGILLIDLFAVRAKVLPAGGYVPWGEDPGRWFESMLLPWLTLAFAPASVVARVTRARVADEARRPHVQTARSLGISRSRIVRHYILRNSLLEPTTVLGIQFGYMLGGVVLIEQVFSLPGIGRLALLAANQGDFPIVQFTALVATLAYLVANLLVDVVHITLESRLQHG